jgi:hypothetical protein
VTNVVTYDQSTTSAVARNWDMLIERRVDFAKDDPTHRSRAIHVRRAILCGHLWTGVGPIPNLPGRPCRARDPPPNSGVHNHA